MPVLEALGAARRAQGQGVRRLRRDRRKSGRSQTAGDQEGGDRRPVHAAHPGQDHAQQVLRAVEGQASRLRCGPARRTSARTGSSATSTSAMPSRTRRSPQQPTSTTGRSSRPTRRPADRKTWVDQHNPAPPMPPKKPWTAPLSTVFSPHNGDAVLKRYAELAGEAKQGLCMTFAFGMNDLFKQVYKSLRHVLAHGVDGGLRQRPQQGRGDAEDQGDADARPTSSSPIGG